MLDVTNLYTKIPVKEVTELVTEDLNFSYLHTEVVETIDILNISLQQNFFKFDDNIYTYKWFMHKYKIIIARRV